MFPLLSVIVALIVGLSYPALVTGPREPNLLGAAAVALLYGAGARLLYDAAVRRCRARDESRGPALLRAALAVRVGAVAAYGIIVYRYDWPALTRGLGIEGWILLDEILILAPFAVLLLLSFLASWSGESRLEVHDFRRGAYVAFQARQYLLPVLPVFLFLLLRDSVEVGARAGIRWVAELEFHYASYPFLQWITLAVFLLLLYGAVPFLVRWFWRAAPLPPGPLRERLLQFSRREGFRARDILVWPTEGNVMNAAVIGVAGPVRYVLITDALLEALPPEEVEAVFAHEVGHAKHNHMLLFLLFTLGYALLTFLLADTLERPLSSLLAGRPYSYLLFGIGAFLAWFGILFGFVSRRFEQQADVYGAQATGRVRGEGGDAERHPFVRALEGLSRQLGDIREVKGWRHFSLGERIDFLKRFLTDPEVRRRYRRGKATLLAFFLGLLAALGTAAAATVPSQLERGRVQATFLRAAWLERQGRRREALREMLRGAELARATVFEAADWREVAMRAHDRSRREDVPPLERAGALVQLAIAYTALGELAPARDALQDAWMLTGDDPGILRLLGDAYLREGRARAARLAYEAALAELPPDHRLAELLERRLAELPD